MKIKKFLFSAVLVSSLICFLAIPLRASAIEINLFGFSEKTPQTFSEFEAENILRKFSAKLFAKWTALEANGYSDPREKTVLSFLKQVNQYHAWNYVFQELPIEVSVNVIKAVAEIVRTVTSDNVMNTVIEKLEKETVSRSVEYAKQQLFNSKVKVAFGAIGVNYNTGEVKVDSSLQYIMVYTPIDEEKGNIVVRIYSPYALEPPVSHGSIGMIMGFVSDLPEGEKIPPFVAEFKGVIGKKNFSWDYSWYGDPSISVYFPANVPDFGFRPVSFWDKYIVNPLKGMIDDVTGLFGKLFQSKGEVVQYLPYEEQSQEVKQEVQEMSSNVNTYVNNQPVVKEEKKEEPVKTLVPETIIKEVESPKQEQPKQEQPKQECVLNSTNPKRNKVLINEVAWMGTKDSANDEWIELKNISNSSINIKGWSLYDKDKQINLVFKEDYFLLSGGLLLLERTDDDSVPFIKADFIYSGALANKDEALFLFDSNCELQDFVEANSQWPAGDNEEKRTMERGDDLTWHAYSGTGCMNIFGTPKQENSLKVETQENNNEESSSSASKDSSNNSSGTTSGSFGGGGIIISYCSQSNLNNSLLTPVIINEVAWMGTQTSSSDEWIELKNVSGQDVNLNGWQLLDKDGQIKVVFSAIDVIAANGFYLLERTDDVSVPNIPLDKKYSGALADTNESLRLFSANCELVDEVKAEENWPAGDGKEKKTMERNDDLNGWHTYSLSLPDGVSGLWGTPKKTNSEKLEEKGSEKKEEEQQVANGVIISEISLGDNEYVELFNQSEEDINLCLEESNCYYLAYFANTFDAEGKPRHDWSNPSDKWALQGKTIGANSYLLLESGNFNPFQLNNSTASLALFSNNPIYTGEEEKTAEEKMAYAQSLKIDAVGWKDKASSPEPEVREGQAFILSETGVFGRKYIKGKYVDNNDNLKDFEMQKASPLDKPSYPPEAISDLNVQETENRRNYLVLSWTPSVDQDTIESDLDYEVYYSLNQEIDANNLISINDYVKTEIKKEEGKVSVLIPDLYYDSNYFFAVKAKDLELNYSPLSNIVNHSISPAQHIKPSLYLDYGRRNESKLAGPTNENKGEITALVTITQNWVEYLNSPLIDENGDIYFSGAFVPPEGIQKGIFAYSDKNQKWYYPCVDSGCGQLFLNSDGSIYSFNNNNLIALSPSGKLKWQKNFSQIYSQRELVIDPNKKLYFLGGSSFFVLTDKQNTVEVTFFDLGKSYTYFSNLVLDDQGNLYFFADTTLFKFNSSGKIGERVFEIVYDEGYEGEKNKTGHVNTLSLSSQGTLLFNIVEGGYNKEGKAYNIFYALNKDNMAESFWQRTDLCADPIGISGNQFFMQCYSFGDYANYVLRLYGINIQTGETMWLKYWFNNSTPHLSVSAITSDINGNIYFVDEGIIKAYNLSHISDEKPDNDIVFSSFGGKINLEAPVALGKGVMYVWAGEKINKIVFNP